MILYENTKPIEHALLHPTCVLSHLMCSCKHCNVKLSLYYWTHWNCWWVYHFVKHRYLAIFNNNLDKGRLKQQIWVEKTLCGNPGHMRQIAYSRNLKWTFEDLLRVIVTQQRPRVQQSASKFRNLPLQAKGANCALALSVSGVSRSRLCPDGPRVHLSGPAYMPSCIRPEVRVPLDQRILCSDCCKKMSATMPSPGSLLLFCTA